MMLSKVQYVAVWALMIAFSLSCWAFVGWVVYRLLTTT